jgi:hypothetical protein
VTVTRLRCQVDDEHGTAVVYLEPPSVTPEQRAAVSAVIAELSPSDRDFVLARLIRKVADNTAYDRVRAERGLLL